MTSATDGHNECQEGPLTTALSLIAGLLDQEHQCNLLWSEAISLKALLNGRGHCKKELVD
eukprot:2850480-Amphidinium_carterae.1